METKKRFTTIEGYIKAQPTEVQKRLRVIKQIVKRVAPHAIESIGYNMPVFKVGSSILVYFAAHTNHIGLYPYPGAIKAFKKESTKYKTARGSIQFPNDQKLPLTLIAKIIKYRVKEKSVTVTKPALIGSVSKKHVVFHSDGSVWGKGRMVGGKQDGFWVWFRKDGTRMRSGSFSRGKQKGTWTTYDKMGKVYRITNF